PDQTPEGSGTAGAVLSEPAPPHPATVAMPRASAAAREHNDFIGRYTVAVERLPARVGGPPRHAAVPAGRVCVPAMSPPLARRQPGCVAFTRRWVASTRRVAPNGAGRPGCATPAGPRAPPVSVRQYDGVDHVDHAVVGDDV